MVVFRTSTISEQFLTGLLLSKGSQILAQISTLHVVSRERVRAVSFGQFAFHSTSLNVSWLIGLNLFAFACRANLS